MRKKITTLGQFRELTKNLSDDAVILMPDDLAVIPKNEDDILILKQTPGGNLFYEGEGIFRTLPIQELIGLNNGSTMPLAITETDMILVLPEGLKNIDETGPFIISMMDMISTESSTSDATVWIIRAKESKRVLAVTNQDFDILMEKESVWPDGYEYNEVPLWTVDDYDTAVTILFYYGLNPIDPENDMLYASLDGIKSAINRENPKFSLIVGIVDREHIYDEPNIGKPTCIGFVSIRDDDDAGRPIMTSAWTLQYSDAVVTSKGIVESVNRMIPNFIQPKIMHPIAIPGVRDMLCARFLNPDDTGRSYTSILDVIMHSAAFIGTAIEELDLISIVPEGHTVEELLRVD